LFTDQIQSFMARVGEDDDIRTRLWQTYAREADSLYTFMVSVAKSGYYDRAHATTFCSSFGCKREVAFSALGWERVNPPDWKGQSIFTTGYCTELKLKAMLECAGFNLEPERAYELPGWVTPDEHQIHVQPDGLLMLSDAQQEQFCSEFGFYPEGKVVIELKSMASKGFARLAGWWAKRGASKGIESNKPGYYDQAQLEMAGAGAYACVFIVENKDTQHLYQEAIKFDKLRYEELRWLFRDVYQHKDPFHFDVPDHLLPGKEKDGRLPLKWQCAYCDFNTTCWEHDHYEFEMDRGKAYVRSKEVEF
jgi:hypothetical protein